jgi:hypothetical protein
MRQKQAEIQLQASIKIEKIKQKSSQDNPKQTTSKVTLLWSSMTILVGLMSLQKLVTNITEFWFCLPSSFSSAVKAPVDNLELVAPQNSRQNLPHDAPDCVHSQLCS